MLKTLTMVANRTGEKPEQSESEADSDLRKIVHVIVTQFNGDTSAYFDSLRRGVANEGKESEEREARIASHFAESI
jgi:hypothetical protein